MAVMGTVSRYRWVILALASISQLSNGLANQAVAPLAPLFQPELGLTKAEVGLFSSATYLGIWVSLVLAGSLTDRFGIRKVMSLGQIVTGMSMAFMAMAGSFHQGVAVMAVAGLGCAAVVPGMTKAIVDWFHPRARATAMGVKQTSMPLAGIGAAMVLPALGVALGWRSALALTGLLIVANGTVTTLMYRDPHSPGREPVRRVRISTVLRESIRNRGLWMLTAISLLFSAVQVAVGTYLVLFFKEIVLVQSVQDESARIVAAGGYLALFQMGGAFARVSWGMVSDRVFHGRRTVVLAVVGSLSALMSLIVGQLGPGHPLWALSLAVIAYGACASGWNGVCLAAIAEVVGPKQLVVAVGLSMTLMQFGNVGGAPLFGFVVDVTGSYGPAWLLLGCLSLGGTVLSIHASRRERRPVP